MLVAIFFGLLLLLFLYAVIMLVIDFYKEVWLKRTRLYNKVKCHAGISNYTGDTDEQILRALVDKTLHPKDIKRFYVTGKTGIAVEENYKLINSIVGDEYRIKDYLSGCSHSRLFRVELDIIDGEATIIRHWIHV